MFELSAIKAITCIPGQMRAFDRCQMYALGHHLSNPCLPYGRPLNLGRIMDRLSKSTSESLTLVGVHFHRAVWSEKISWTRHYY